jgi:predicted Zn-dependent peptidase
MSIATPVATVLPNGTPAWCQQVSGQRHSAISVILPWDPRVHPHSALIPWLGASAAADARLRDLTTRGIQVHSELTAGRTTLSLSGPMEHEAELIATAVDLAKNGLPVDPERFELLKRNEQDRIQRLPNNEIYLLNKAIDRVYWGPTHPLARDAATDLSAIGALTLPQALQTRAQIASQPQAMTIVMNSPRSVAAQQGELRAALAPQGLSTNPAAALPVTELPPPRPIRGTQIVTSAIEKLPRANVQFTWKSVGRQDPDFAAYQILIKAIRSGLLQELRDRRGLVYSTHQNSGSEKDSSEYEEAFTVDYAKVPEAIQATRSYVQRYASPQIAEVLPPATLDTLKRALRLQTKESLVTAPGLNGFTRRRITSGTADETPRRFLDRIDRVTLADVQRVAARTFNAALGPEIIGVAAPASVLAQLNLESLKPGPEPAPQPSTNP